MGSGWRLPALLCALAAWLQALSAAVRESPTWDEPYAIASGYAQVVSGDFRLTPESPPLLGLLITPALKMLRTTPPDLPAGEIAGWTVPGWGARFLYDLGNRHELALLLARMSVMTLTVIAMAALIRLASRLFGARGAWLLAILCAFEPTWLAHGHLAAWDGVGAATMILALCAFTEWLERPRLRLAALSGVTLGLALAARHSALALVPVILIGVLLALARRPGAAGYSLRLPPRRRALAAGVHALLMVVPALLVVGATYNLSFDLTRYFASVRASYPFNGAGFENYLLGELREGPFPSYYLVALLVKTPAATLPLLLLGAASLPRARLERWLPAVILALVMLIATSLNRYQIGVRHVLPAIPCLLLLAAGAASARIRGRSAALLALPLALLFAAETLSQGPYYLAFFNRAAGGPMAALKYLDDSNVDWGQDLVALAELQRRERLGPIALLYNGTARPEAHGVQHRSLDVKELFTPARGEIYALSLNHLHRLRMTHGYRLPLLRGPVWRMAGRSIALYRVP